MKKILLSIVIPTKNRSKYLKSAIDYIASFASNEIEVIVQDNSDDNTDLETYINHNQFPFLKYYYTKRPLSVIDNSDLAISHSNGEYVAYIGDDDFLSKYIVKFVEYMKKKDIESAVFNRASYNWPGVVNIKHTLKNLRIPPINGKVINLDVKGISEHCMRIGATRIENMPRVYHGIVKKECLDVIYRKAGTYFPGPSPDMANAVALCGVVKKHVIFGMPIISSGTSPKSAGGLGAKHEHVGGLKGKKFLPENIEERWYKEIPKIWAGETIYAQSALEAMEAMELYDLRKKYNYIYLYAAFNSFHRDKRELLNYKLGNIGKMKFAFYMVDIFLLRVRFYMRNILETKLNISRGKEFNDIKTSKEAATIVDEELYNFILKNDFTDIIPLDIDSV